MELDITHEIGELIVFEKNKSKYHPEYCAHLHVGYSDDHQTITCKDCEEKLDPMKWVLAHIRLLNQYKAKTDEKLAMAKLIEQRLESKARFCCNKCGEMNDIDFTKMITEKALKAKIKLLDD